MKSDMSCDLALTSLDAKNLVRILSYVADGGEYRARDDQYIQDFARRMVGRLGGIDLNMYQDKEVKEDTSKFYAEREECVDCGRLFKAAEMVDVEKPTYKLGGIQDGASTEKSCRMCAGVDLG